MRRLPVLAAALLVGSVGVVGFAQAQSDPPDHDYDAASELFAGNRPCPTGQSVQVAQWEDLARRTEELQDSAPDGVVYGETAPVDLIQVIPDDPAPFTDTATVPEGSVVTVWCSATSPETAVLVDEDAVIIPEAAAEGLLDKRS